jgi:hypothetical protein
VQWQGQDAAEQPPFVSPKEMYQFTVILPLRSAWGLILVPASQDPGSIQSDLWQIV